MCFQQCRPRNLFFLIFLILFLKFHKIMKSAGEVSTIINIFKYPGLSGTNTFVGLLTPLQYIADCSRPSQVWLMLAPSQLLFGIKITVLSKTGWAKKHTYRVPTMLISGLLLDIYLIQDAKTKKIHGYFQISTKCGKI